MTRTTAATDDEAAALLEQNSRESQISQSYPSSEQHAGHGARSLFVKLGASFFVFGLINNGPCVRRWRRCTKLIGTTQCST